MWRGRCGAAHEGLNVLDELPLLDLELLRLVRVRARVRAGARVRVWACDAAERTTSTPESEREPPALTEANATSV